MAEVVYLLCAAASVACAVLLHRAWRFSGAEVLFWSTVCFMGLAVNNLLLVADLLVLPANDLSVLRSMVALCSIGALIYGLVWDVKDER